MNRENYTDYLKLNGKLLKDGNMLLRKKDYHQASEKFWGAAALIIKAIAAKRGNELKSHGEIYKFVRQLGKELNDNTLLNLFSSARDLHQNFYENWLTPEVVKDLADSVKEFVSKLKPLADGGK